MRNSVFMSLALASVVQGLGPSACSSNSSSSKGAGGGASGSSSVGGGGAASTTTGVCASTCLKDCASDDDCNLSAGDICCDYGPDGKACVPATQCPRYCSDDSRCNVTGGEACMMTVEASSQLVCTQPANALRTCSGNTDCATNETCCTIYKTPVCLATNLCPAACSSSSDCNGAANEVCCTSLPTVDKTLAVGGLCVDTSKVACPRLCSASADCNRSAGETCCDGRCSTTCVKTCTTSSDCPGQICCKTKAQYSPFRTTQTLGYAASTGGSANGGTTSVGGTKATGGTTSPTGGTNATGGRAGASSTGGTNATGGRAGASSTGGTKATAGTAGTSTTGGTAGGTAGASPAGGTNNSGGTTASTASGGTNNSGGTAASTASGGTNNSGGTAASTASGGSNTGGTPATGGTSPTGGTPSSGGTNNSGGTTASTASGGSDTGGTPATGGTPGYCASLTPPTASGSLSIALGIVTVGALQGQAFAATVNGSNTTTCITPKCDSSGVCDAPWGPTALCAAGVVTADSTSTSAAVFGFNLNQSSGGTLGTVSAPPNISVSVVKGTSAGDTAARIILVDNNGISYCVDAGQWSSGSTIPIGRFSTTCWNTSQPGTALSNGASLVSIEVEIPSAVATDRPFAICLTDVKIN